MHYIAKIDVQALCRPLLLLILMLAGSPYALSFDGNLTQAQTQIYDYPHLAKTKPDQIINYTYKLITDGNTEQDNARMSITASKSEKPEDIDRRNVSIDFLSGERRIALPDFDNYRGNPVIIAMLEHICQTLGNTSGGGALYFRNRVRDALSHKDLEVVTDTMDFGGKSIKVRKIVIQPLLNDENLKTYPDLQNASITVNLSDDVLAGVVSISIESADDANEPFQRSLTLIPTNQTEQ